jgi:hypothetical protein
MALWLIQRREAPDAQVRLTERERSWADALGSQRAEQFAHSRRWLRSCLADRFRLCPDRIPLDAPPGHPPTPAAGWGWISISHSRDALLLGWSSLAPASLSSGPLLPRLSIATLALAIPSLFVLCARPFFSQARLERTVYGMLPLFWSLLLANHLPLGMEEAGLVMPVSASPLLGEGAWSLPHWRADPHVIAFCQSMSVTIGALWSAVILRRMLSNNRTAWIAATGLMLLLAATGRWLVNGSG